MRKRFFRDLADVEGGEFYFKDKDILSGHELGVRNPNVTYLLIFSYKDNQFSIFNSTGTSFVGEIACEFSSTLKPIEFELNSISYFLNLFLRRKNRFKIKSDNENIKHFLSKSEAMKKLILIAKKEAFNPFIVCEIEKNKRISTKYHLEFDDWTQVIEPIIELYKELIDEFEKGYLNVSNKAYKELN
ncbi:hypothetical protein [Lacinutrix jangbogonensis]|uniref:hypothetical protein n=1 Tax=Lacinutrix jangbogonensis TaxID=1469557 RepID=UPI00053D372D|nr:hypothetical protein [Lacinutrix jangbogonensis]